MTALAGLIDALLAARLAPRLDVLGIKGEATIGAPGPALPVGKVENDVRLLSNAALDRQIPGAPAGAAAHPGGAAPASISTRLSVAARVIGAVLADLQAEPGPVRGAAPLSPSRQQSADAAVLAGTLARTVADSGLFYESHLAQFAAGARTLAQMAREPQAQWAGPVLARAVAQAEGAAGVPGALQGALSGTLAGASAATPAAASAVAADAADAMPPSALAAAAAQAELPPAGEATHSNSTLRNTPAGAPAQPPAQAVVPQGAAPAAEAGTPAHAAALEASRLQAAYGQPGDAVDGAASAHRAAQAARLSDSAAAAQAARPGEVIHPQAVTIVHQQLDLLAGAVFRWSGQAWPDVPMQWSIEEEQPQQQARSDARECAEEEGTRRWSTTVSLQLPRLGEVDLRLSVVGPAVQAQLSARESATMALLRGDTGRLARRFEAAGLDLQQLQVTAKAAAPAQAEAA